MAKKKIICDTDVMIDYWDISNPRHARTKSSLETSVELNNVVLSAITKMELLLGAANKAEMIAINKKLVRYNIALLNNNITLQALDLIRKYRLSHGIALADSLIAATALVTDLELYTYNTKDFVFISGLKLYTT